MIPTYQGQSKGVKSFSGFFSVPRQAGETSSSPLTINDDYARSTTQGDGTMAGGTRPEGPESSTYGLGAGYIWSPFDSPYQAYNNSLIYCNGSRVVIPVNGYDSYRLPELYPEAGEFSFDFYVPAIADTLSLVPAYGMWFTPRLWDTSSAAIWPSIYVFSNGDGTWQIGAYDSGLNPVGASPTGSFTPDEEVMYRCTLDYDAATSICQYKVWKVGDTEPDWMFSGVSEVSFDVANVPFGPPGGDPYLGGTVLIDFWEGSTTVDCFFDNLYVPVAGSGSTSGVGKAYDVPRYEGLSQQIFTTAKSPADMDLTQQDKIAPAAQGQPLPPPIYSGLSKPIHVFATTDDDNPSHHRPPITSVIIDDFDDRILALAGWGQPHPYGGPDWTIERVQDARGGDDTTNDVSSESVSAYGSLGAFIDYTGGGAVEIMEYFTKASLELPDMSIHNGGVQATISINAAGEPDAKRSEHIAALGYYGPGTGGDTAFISVSRLYGDTIVAYDFPFRGGEFNGMIITFLESLGAHGKGPTTSPTWPWDYYREIGFLGGSFEAWIYRDAVAQATFFYTTMTGVVKVPWVLPPANDPDAIPTVQIEASMDAVINALGGVTGSTTLDVRVDNVYKRGGISSGYGDNVGSSIFNGVIFRPQFGDPTTTLDASVCLMESAAMALDWHTRGGLQLWGGQLVPWCGRPEAQIRVIGTSLQNARQAWAHFGQYLDIRAGQPWTGLMAALNEGRAVILAGVYGDLINRCSTFTGNHAVVVLPYFSGGGSKVMIGDPLCPDFKFIDISDLQTYAESLGVAFYGSHSPQPVYFGVSQAWPE